MTVDEMAAEFGRLATELGAAAAVVAGLREEVARKRVELGRASGVYGALRADMLALVPPDASAEDVDR